MEIQLLQEQSPKSHPKVSLTFISKGNVVNLPFDEITYVSKQGSATVIHTQKDQHTSCMSVQDILNDLPAHDFIRIHKSHVIALHYFKGFAGNRAILDTCHLPVTAYYKRQSIKKLGETLDQLCCFMEKR